MEEERKYSLYVHINKKDDFKAYVGISKNPKKRWRNGEGYKSQDKFYNAIKKYGWNGFKHIILLENLTLQEAWEKEKEYIKKYDSINDGYNVSEGGQLVITPEMIQKGYITKRLKNSGVTIFRLSDLKSIHYDTVEEASKSTGISEHWFYRCYKKEIEPLQEFDVLFDLDIDTSQFKILAHSIHEKKRPLLLEDLTQRQKKDYKKQHQEAKILAKKIIQEKNEEIKHMNIWK